MAVISSIQIDTSSASKSIADLEKELQETNEQLKQVDINSDAFKDLQKKAADAKGQLDKINQTTDTLSKGFQGFGENLAKVTGGISGGITAATAAMQLMGVENENVMEGIAKLQQLMAFTQGISAMKDLTAGVKGLGVALKVASGPLGIIAGVITGLVLIWKNWGDEIRKSIPAVDTLATAIEKAVSKLKGMKSEAAETKEVLDQLTKTEDEIAKLRLEKQVNALNSASKALYNQNNEELKLLNLEKNRYSLLLKNAKSEEEFNSIRAEAEPIIQKIHDLEKANADLLANPSNFTEPVKEVAKEISNIATDLQSSSDILNNMLAAGRGKGSNLEAPDVEREEEEDDGWGDKVTEAQNYYNSLFELELSEEESFRLAQDEKRNQLQQFYADGLISAEQYNTAIAKLNDEARDYEEEQEKKKKKYKLQMYSQAATGIADILDSLASTMDESNEKQFKAMKAMQIASATIQMMVGITTALSGAFTTKTGPWDIALAVIQATSIAASGAAQIANIAKQQYNSDSSSTSTATASLSAAASAITTPEQYSTAVEGVELESSISDSKVYVVESDIQAVGNKVNVQETENRY